MDNSSGLSNLIGIQRMYLGIRMPRVLLGLLSSESSERRRLHRFLLFIGWDRAQ